VSKVVSREGNEADRPDSVNDAPIMSYLEAVALIMFERDPWERKKIFDRYSAGYNNFLRGKLLTESGGKEQTNSRGING